MAARVSFAVITLFWVTMNVLLWRVECGSRHSLLSAVPPELVWRKVLTSPDSSSLTILHQGKVVGFCRWTTAAGQEWEAISETNLPEGAPRKERSYGLRAQGSIVLEGWTNRLRFEMGLTADARYRWRELRVRWSLPPVSGVVRCVADGQTATIDLRQGKARFERSFKFSDLESLARLGGQHSGSLLAEWLEQMNAPTMSELMRSPDLGGRWEACEEIVRIGRLQTQGFQVDTQLLNRYRVSVLVSRVGELLRVDLPGQWVLVNDQLKSFSDLR